MHGRQRGSQGAESGVVPALAPARSCAPRACAPARRSCASMIRDWTPFPSMHIACSGWIIDPDEGHFNRHADSVDSEVLKACAIEQ